MQAIPWRRLPTSGSLFFRTPNVAFFHSTPVSLAKSKCKWKEQDGVPSEKPSKTYIRYAVRQKRADAKSALKNFVLYGKPLEPECEGQGKSRKKKRRVEIHAHDFYTHPGSTNSGNFNSHGQFHNRKGERIKNKRGQGKIHEYEDEEACFDFSGHFTWRDWGGFSFNHSTSGFEWRDQSKSEKAKTRVWNESDVDDEEPAVGKDLHSHRVSLGLPKAGPLNLDDVKSAYRLSALRWHPDKHQGSSKVLAAEKFRLCVEAYNTLCKELKLK